MIIEANGFSYNAFGLKPGMLVLLLSVDFKSTAKDIAAIFICLGIYIRIFKLIFHTTHKKICENVRSFFSYQCKKSAKTVFMPYLNQAIGGALSEKKRTKGVKTISGIGLT